MSRPNRPSLGQYDFALRNPPTNEPQNRSRANSRLPDYDPIRIPEVQIESSSDDDIPISKPRRPAQHSRSMSHPFPSLFSSKKKKIGRAGDNFGEDDSTDDVSPKQNVRQSPQPHAAPRRIPRGPADFSTGNCMTCASLVRWPKELHVFRCTICLTINDLKPHDSVVSNDGIQPSASGPLPSNGTESGPSRPLQLPRMFLYILENDYLTDHSSEFHIS